MKAKVPVLWQLMTWLQLELEQLEQPQATRIL